MLSTSSVIAIAKTPSLNAVVRPRSLTWSSATAPGSSRRRTELQPVGLAQLGVLRGQQLGEPDHHLALLPGRVVLHLAVEHVDAAAVGDRLEHAAREAHLLRVGGEDALGDLDLARVQRPRADAAHEEGRAELRLAALDVGDVAER